MPLPLTEKERVLETIKGLTDAERALPTSVVAMIVMQKMTKPDVHARLVKTIEEAL